MIATADRVTLRRVRHDDGRLIDAIDFDADDGVDWRYGGAVPSEEERRGRLWSPQVVDQRIIVAGREAPVIGYATAYDLNPRTATAWVAVASHRGARAGGLAMLGFGLFVTTVFAAWPVRRLYAESRQSSFDAFASGVDGVAVRRCGTFAGRQQRPDGTRADVHWLEIDRVGWLERYGWLGTEVAPPTP